MLIPVYDLFSTLSVLSCISILAPTSSGVVGGGKLPEKDTI